MRQYRTFCYKHLCFFVLHFVTLHCNRNPNIGNKQFTNQKLFEKGRAVDGVAFSLFLYVGE